MASKTIRERSRTPARRKWSSARYMIFWAAPGHLIGVAGKVKTAVPPVNERMRSQVRCAPS